jgi:hypothetical protein
MYIVHTRLIKRSTDASPAGFSEALRTLMVPQDGIEHFYISDSGTGINVTFFVLLPTLADAETAALDVCERVISSPGEDGNWVITHCMATIVPQAGGMLICGKDKPDRSGP